VLENRIFYEQKQAFLLYIYIKYNMILKVRTWTNSLVIRSQISLLVDDYLLKA